MYLTIRGKRWHYREVRMKDHGDCDPPHVKNKTIRIRKGQSGQHKLDSIIHEILHAGLWDLSEETVEEVASDISRALWRLGYREV